MMDGIALTTLGTMRFLRELKEIFGTVGNE